MLQYNGKWNVLVYFTLMRSFSQPLYQTVSLCAVSAHLHCCNRVPQAQCAINQKFLIVLEERMSKIRVLARLGSVSKPLLLTGGVLSLQPSLLE